MKYFSLGLTAVNNMSAMRLTKDRFVQMWLTVVVLLFACALALPAYLNAAWGTVMGYQFLVIFPFAMMHLAWWSNLVLIIGVGAAAVGASKELVVVGLFGLCLALTFPFALASDDKLLVGFSLWFSSHLLFVLGSLYFHLDALARTEFLGGTPPFAEPE